ncbi:MAG: DUF2431 domain-containing protein, partial [Chlamydiae bacterium]|nr:DUF2431 domain-containing protein [Chlamydiota bacterium]
MAVDLQRRVLAKPHRVLIVGDGDCSFGAAYVKRHQGRDIIVSTFDSKTAVQKYRYYRRNEQRLNALGIKILHGIDATRLKDYYDWATKPFDRIIFNFPNTQSRDAETAKLVGEASAELKTQRLPQQEATSPEHKQKGQEMFVNDRQEYTLGTSGCRLSSEPCEDTLN